MSPKTKQRAAFLAKLLVTTALVYWLVKKGALDMRALSIFLEQKSLLVLDLVVFLAASVVVAAVRWMLLLRLAEVRVPFWRAVHLQFVSLFFNVVIPGNVGGDVIKALYVAREEPTEKRTTLVLIAFVERLVGLAGLVSVGLVVMAVRGPALWQNELFRPMISVIALLGAGFVLGPTVLVFVMRAYGEKLEAMASGTSKVAGLVKKIVTSFRLVSGRPRLLLAGLGLSMVLHGVNIVFFTMLAGSVGKQEVTLGAISTIYPIGLLSLMLPISAAGMGVGHMAFEKLFSAVGYVHGADVFNVFFFGQIGPCMFGVIPYLALRSKEPGVETGEASGAGEEKAAEESGAPRRDAR